VQSEGEALLESTGVAAFSSSATRFPKGARRSVAEYFEKACPDAYIVVVIAREWDDYSPQAHAKVMYSKDHAVLATLFRQRFAA
jgi:hypothetical protein